MAKLIDPVDRQHHEQLKIRVDALEKIVGKKDMGWQPIATAPKNKKGKSYGPTLMLWLWGSDDPIFAYWSSIEELWLPNNSHTPIPVQSLITHWRKIKQPKENK